MDNDVETFDGGAIYLLSFSQFTLYPGAYLDFINNAGRYGTYAQTTLLQIYCMNVLLESFQCTH